MFRPTFHPSRIVTCAGLLGCLILCGDAHGQAPAYLRLGSWNIEHLGNPGAARGSGENVAQQPSDLARYLRYAKLDLVAVQEISADADAPAGFPKKYRTNSTLTKSLHELNKSLGERWNHILFPKMRAADSSQWVGLAWNSAKVKPVGDIFQVPVSHARSSQDSNRWDRNVHALMFSAGKDKTDFAVIVMHLKANANASFARHRGEEMAELIKRLPDLYKAFPGERDYILVGDTNIQDAQEPAVKALEQAGFRDLNKNDLDTHTAKGVQPFDRIFVPGKQPEFSQSTLEVLNAFQKKERLSFAEYRARFSDHYLIVTSIQIMADDD